MLEFTARNHWHRMEKGVSRDEETETRESEEKKNKQNYEWEVALPALLSDNFSVCRQIPIFQACSGEPGPCLSIHQSLKRRLLESHREGRQALRSPLISPFHPSFFSPLMNTSLLWWTGRLERGRGRGRACLRWRTWLEAETGRGRREGWPVALTTISVAHRFVANRF